MVVRQPQRWRPIVLLTAVAALRTAAGLSNREKRTVTPIDVGSRRELLIDDHLIDTMTGGASLRLHHPTPRELVLQHEEPWEGTGSGYHTVFRDDGLYRMFYRGWHLEVVGATLRSDRHAPVVCYAESDDGIHWRKPELGIVEFNGSKQNNIVWQGVGSHNFCPFKDANPDCTPEARYKALGGLKGEGGAFAFKSADGLHWSLLTQEPVLTEGAFDSQNLAFWDSVLGKYRAYWRTFTEGVTEKDTWEPAGIRAIRTAASDDLLHWREMADLTYVDSPPEELYTNQVAPYARAPHILIGLPTRYVERGWSDSMRALPDPEHREMRSQAHLRYGTAITEALLMAGRDGVRFKRWNEGFMRPGIERPGTWNYGHHFVAWHTVETGSALEGAPNELSFYGGEGYWTGQGSALRRYTLRLDGFVSANAGMDGGELLTKPLTFAGSQLRLNLATSAAGGLGVEIQQPDGTPVPRFALENCGEVFGDTIDRVVTWKHGADVAELSGRPVKLRFQLRDADLYAFRFSD